MKANKGGAAHPDFNKREVGCMRKLLKFMRFIVPFLTTICVFLSSVFSPATLVPPYGNAALSVLEFPAEAVKTLEEAGLTEAELLARGSDELPEYVQSAGHPDMGGLICSPYYTARIGEMAVPVYAAMVYVWDEDSSTAGLHSFSEVYVDTSRDFAFTLELTGVTVPVRDAVVLPRSLQTGAVCKNNVMRVSITKPGLYTFLFNGAKQPHGYSLFVREKIDDDAQIAQYVAQYGEENVIVLDRGVYEFDFVNTVDEHDLVYYLREGAYVIAKHHYDIRKAEDDQLYVEPGAYESSVLHPRRVSFLNFHRCRNITLAGHGVIDLSRLDRGERDSLVMTECENMKISGIKLVNAPGWTLFSYCCSGLQIDNVDIFGCRGNSDAFALCNTQDAVVNNCFARSADDLFEVKTLGGKMGSRGITYRNCVGWSGYARCFGVTGEVCCPIEDIAFRDCAVIWRNATWDNNRIGSLVVVAEQTIGSIDGVTFDNIEIFRDEGRPINVKVYDEDAENFSMQNIIFRNIRYTSYLPAQVASNEHDGNTVQVQFENIRANGFDPAASLIRRWLFSIDRKCSVTFN